MNMKKYQKIGYIMMATVLLITIILIILVHSFNSTPESGEPKEAKVTESVRYGD